MKLCPHCGSQLSDDAKFCVECGQALPEDAPQVVTPAPEAPAAEAPAEAPAAPAPVEAAPVPAAAPSEPPVAPSADGPIITQMPPKKQMLSTGQYFALSLLYALPVIGLVFLFVFGAGHPKNGSLKRYSAAMLILRLLVWIAVLAMLIVAMIKNGRLLTDAMGQFIPALQNLLKAIFA